MTINFNFNMSSKKENFFEKIKNNLMRKYYIQEDSLFKLLYDKYLRPEIFKGILNKSIKNDKDVYEVKCFNLSVIRNENSDNMNDIEIKREMNSLKFFKYQAFVIKGQFFLCSLSALALSTGVLVLLAKSNYCPLAIPLPQMYPSTFSKIFS